MATSDPMKQLLSLLTRAIKIDNELRAEGLDEIPTTWGALRYHIARQETTLERVRERKAAKV
jgi:hypothetical protein